MIIRNLISAAVITAVIFGTGNCTVSDNTAIIVKGSTTMGPITGKLAEAFQSEKKLKIIVNSQGSHSGLDALINGDCNIAESSSEASQEYLEKASKADVSLKAFLIAHDYILPVVHPLNKIERMTVKQLHEIYTGTIMSWEAVGGKTQKITVVCRDKNSGTSDVWNSVLGLGKEVCGNSVIVKSNSSVLAFVAENANCIGYISAAFLNSEVKALKISGKGPYPIYRNLYFYVDENKFDDRIRSFIVFTLSNEGQKLIKDMGFVPVAEK
ncbi:MAG: phosphate ABC transporter substrate-binding protein [Spirochaetes bacterium]|nr:phosphate ABC transporter substrate-binding protein [Spirochaetota bacterium]